MIQNYIYDKSLFDSHCHISMESDEHINLIISNATSANLSCFYDVSVDIESSLKSLHLSKQNSFVKSFVGVDPEVFIPREDSFETIFDKTVESYLSALRNIVVQNKGLVYGIGEIGMDSYKLKKLKYDEHIVEKSLSLQEQLFRGQLEIASEYKLPVSLHSRGVESRCLEIAKRYVCFGIFHSFTGTYEDAKGILDAGWGLGMNGIITYKNANELREVYRKILGKIPSDVSPSWFYDRGVYFETDSPYLSPEPIKRTKNQPANVSLVWEGLRKNSIIF